MAHSIPDLAVPVPRLSPRATDSHKGTYGRVLVVAGSRGMSGAAVLAGSAALRGGAGLVQVAVPADVQSIVAATNPCYMTAGLPADENGRFAAGTIDELVRLADWADVIALGPGIGQSEATPSLIQSFLRRTAKPLVIDADGLNALAKLPAGQWSNRAAPTILTPHPGEFARLTGRPADEIRRDRESAAVTFASDRAVVLVLKGHQTIVTDGRQVYENTTGNPGMATGGTGDVLTGLIAALVGQRLAAFDAAVLGVWVHGRAGDLGAAEYGHAGLIASDLLTKLPDALREVGG